MSLSVTAVRNLRLARVGAEVQKRYVADRRFSSCESNFAKDGAVAFEIPTALVERLKGYFSDRNEIKFDVSKVIAGYDAPQLPPEVVNGLNHQNIFYGQPDEPVIVALAQYLDQISGAIEEELSFNFHVVNVRAWQSKPHADFGPSNWHHDGAYEFFMPKLMLYINGPNEENGSIEFFTRSGQRTIFSTDRAAAILLDSSTLLHRGLASKKSLRPIIEITLAPSLETSTRPTFAGQNARFPISHLEELERVLDNPRLKQAVRTRTAPTLAAIPLSPSIAKYVTNADPINSAVNSAKCVNIGGGPTFSHPGWINLDAFPGEGVAPFRLSEKKSFPIPSSTIQLVYTSHCLEHLPEDAVEFCLREARRVLRSGGDLIVKVPNYDAVLEAYRTGNDAFFKDEWGLEGISHLWKNLNVEDNIDTRASMIFCGFWTPAYGVEFGGSNIDEVRQARRASLWSRLIGRSKQPKVADDVPYHGPAAISSKKTRAILSQKSPKKIAQDLKKHILKSEGDCTFNHQTAFSKMEMEAIIKNCGFVIRSSDAEIIRQEFSAIPDINSMKDISMYFHCSAS